MAISIDEIEARILGALIEKQMTTPEYYPLSLNALTNACNQKSNRHPVVSFDETTVVRGLDRLRSKELSEKVMRADSRTPKYEQRLSNFLDLGAPETALICELMLRGPQTSGELRGRADRMHPFENPIEVETLLEALMSLPEPLVMKLPRQVGQKERRYTHLLCGTPDITEEGSELNDEPATLKVRADDERMAAMEAELTTLKAELAALRAEFDELKAQLE